MQQMLANLRARREDERGFTLIELMVVVLIIAILIAIAIPTFLGAKSRAQDKAAQSSLRNALTNAKGIYTDTDLYTSATPSALQTAEPSLTFTAGASTGPKVVSVATTAQGFVAAALSAGGNCYVIGDGANGPGTIFMNHGAGGCTASTAGVFAIPGAVPTAANATTVDVWAQAW